MSHQGGSSIPASTTPRRSPSISASIIAIADTPVTSDTTEDSLIPADSSVFCSRWTSDARAWTVFILYAEARIMPMPGQMAWVPAVGGVKTSA